MLKKTGDTSPGSFVGFKVKSLTCIAMQPKLWPGEKEALSLRHNAQLHHVNAPPITIHFSIIQTPKYLIIPILIEIILCW